MKADMRHARFEPKVVTNTRVGVRWEHRSAKMDSDADMSQFSGEGWELVSVVPTPADPGTVTAYFKRAA